MDDFGARLRKVREAKRLDQREIARLTAKRGSEKAATEFANYLSRIERGAAPNPALDTLERIAHGLGFKKLSDFFTELEEIGAEGLQSATKPHKDRSRPPEPSHGDQVSAPATGEFLSIVRDFSVELTNITVRLQDARARFDRSVAGADPDLPARRGSVARLDRTVPEK